MGLFVCLIALAPVKCLYATTCVADAGLPECGSNVDEQRKAASTLIQQTQSLSKSSWEQNLLSFSAPGHRKDPDYSKYPPDEPLEAHHLMKPPETEEESSIADALALTLIGAVLAVACLIYLINWPDKDIERATWKVLSESLMIFCAVLFFDAILKSTQWLNKEHPDPTTDSPDHAEPDAASLRADAVRVGVIFLIFEGVMQYTREKSSHGVFESFGFLGSHILGFAIIQFAAHLQQTSPWNTSVFMAFMLTVITAFTVVSVFLAVNFYRSRCMQATKNDKHSRHHFDHWKKMCTEFQDEACGLAIGLLICQTIKFLITGHLPPVHGSPRDKTKQQVRLLGLSALGFSGAVALLSQFLHSHRKYHQDSPFAKRTGHILYSIASMAEGWCLLYWGQWLFWNTTGDKGVGEGDVMTARLMLMVFFGTFGFFLIFIINFLAHRGLMNLEEQRSLIDSVGLLLGLTWESCINAAMEGLHSSLFRKDASLYRPCDGGTDLVIALVVSPAWAWYILPHAMRLVHGGEMEFDTQKPDAWPVDDDDDDDETTCCCAPIGR